MRNLSFLCVLLVSCSTIHHPVNYHRDLASLSASDPVTFDLSLSEPLTLANGADDVVVRIILKNSNGEVIKASVGDIKILLDSAAGLEKITVKDNAFYTSVRPRAKSGALKLVVIYKNQVSQPLEVKTTLVPRGDKMLPIKSDSNNMIYVNGLSYSRQDNFPEGRFEGFAIDNRGKNAIVNAEDSQRNFEFNYEEQVAQNISLMVSDAPNGTVSHTMHSHMMFFPRTYLPLAEMNKNEEVTVTLSNGEQIMFAKSGEITGGIFKEGPVDIGPDRFKRTYADLKYQGKGILLRANARGQMPQQGQFEATKIDMEYGIKYSADVLIINGTTGQRCRRPKIDFWPSEDVSPIQFKFPSDKDFDVYLKAKCGFGIPELNLPMKLISIEAQDEIKKVWGKCSDSSDVEDCLNDEVAAIEDEGIKARVRYELTIRIIKERVEEEKKIDEVIARQVAQIRTTLLKDASWSEKGCLAASQGLVKNELQYFDIKLLIQDELVKNCSTVKEEMKKFAATEVGEIKIKLETDLAWASLGTKDKIAADCLKQAQSYVTSGFRYYQDVSLYTAPLKAICETMESSSAYQDWLKTQGAGLEEKIFASVLEKVETRADEKAQSCLVDFPMDTQLNRVRFKRQRESCLIDSWTQIEAVAISEARKDPLVQKVGLDMDTIATRIAMERRRLQLKLMKKYFM